MKCENCGKEVENANYCSNCGNAITKLAKEYEKVKTNGIKLEILLELSEKANDEKTKEFIKTVFKKI